MEELNNVTTTEEVPEAPQAKVEKISLAELRAEENKYYEEQKTWEAERKRKEEKKKKNEKEKNEAFSKEIDDFFESLLALSQEDRAEFFKLIDEDLKNGGR